MKILVTGATGFIGTNLVPHLALAGYQVASLQRDAAPCEGAAASWRVGENGEGIREAMSRFTPDVVVHLAALFLAEHRYEDIAPLVRANVEFGTQVLDAMRDSGCKAMVYAGTSWQHYRDEDYCPVNLYAATKQAFSALVDYYRDEASFRIIELHLYDSYGRNDRRKKLIDLLQRAADAGTELAMSAGKQALHLVHVDDIVRGFAAACEQVIAFGPGERRVYRLPSVEAVSLQDLVAIFNAADPERPVRVRWGERPYREREVFEPWENGEVLPGWKPRIRLADGLQQLRQAGQP